MMHKNKYKCHKYAFINDKPSTIMVINLYINLICYYINKSIVAPAIKSINHNGIFKCN